jgi:hypothetical protein
MLYVQAVSFHPIRVTYFLFITLKWLVVRHVQDEAVMISINTRQTGRSCRPPVTVLFRR